MSVFSVIRGGKVIDPEERRGQVNPESLSLRGLRQPGADQGKDDAMLEASIRNQVPRIYTDTLHQLLANIGGVTKN